MVRLEEIKPGTILKGVRPNLAVTVIGAEGIGDAALKLTYQDANGNLGQELLYRNDEAKLELVPTGNRWTFAADGELLRMASEAYRIHLAYLFDPMLAVHISDIDPLPHQITAVYEEMLPRQPLRFLLADDPGAGKTVMAGLFIKELILRGDVRRCLIVAPGSLVEQWQDELDTKFGLHFEIFSREMSESSRTGNPFLEKDRLIARLDHLSRNQDLLEKLEMANWDLVICDEAHKMSASFFGGEVRYTKRYRLGQLLEKQSRHFLLMSATPHNGKEEDFQLFMALLDADRFEGKFREGVHVAETSDLMRRMIKEQLVKFDGRPLFPERRAYSVEYTLSSLEAELYREVTSYVTEEMNRADELEGNQRTVVGFALTILQRRLASSPEAIFQSLKRRRQRLEIRLAEEQAKKKSAESELSMPKELAGVVPEDWDDFEDAPDAEVETVENQLLDLASASRTIAQLEKEIETLKRLETKAQVVRRSGVDRKWDELSGILQNNAPQLEEGGRLRKLIVFTEHRDTLNYLQSQIRNLFGRAESVITIHGGLNRRDRKKAEEIFKNDPEVLVLVATDAAGEGINLQRAHLMVNYDLPWNPNRIEQRFGRIHRIKQTEVCHLWNLVAVTTREGQVFQRLLEKLEKEREALGGKVFDVLGKVFNDVPLRNLLLEAIRYGDQPEIKAKLNQVIDQHMDRHRLEELLEEHALARETMDVTRVRSIREEMECLQARRLQPHNIAAFFLAAFKHLGGAVRNREADRYAITHVPAEIRNWERKSGRRVAIANKYERITFDKTRIDVDGKPGPAEFICPGHPLLDATIELVLEKHFSLLNQGSVLIDQNAEIGDEIRVLFFLDHIIQDARLNSDGTRRTISRRMQFVEITESGAIIDAGIAPYLDYRPMESDETRAVQDLLQTGWLQQDCASQVVNYAVAEVVPGHLDEVRSRRLAAVEKTRTAVRKRLLAEINYWDNRANHLREQERAGKVNAKLNSENAQVRANDLELRLKRREAELEQERHVSPLPPTVIGGAVVIPVHLLREMELEEIVISQEERRRIDRLAIAKVMETERQLGRIPREMEHNHNGYDICSTEPESGEVFFLEVKGKAKGSTTVTVSRSQILTAHNKPETFILAIVEIEGESVSAPVYIRKPFDQVVEFSVTSVNYNLKDLLQRGQTPVATKTSF
ncbi:MAG: DUF3883 domain-containing protein [Blastocatellia bacterium]|nr:DUF3883 domain-containing protein [Blastocatellia bacterium]